MKTLALVSCQQVGTVLQGLKQQYEDKKMITLISESEFLKLEDDQYHQVLLFFHDQTMTFNSLQAYLLLHVRDFQQICFEKRHFPNWRNDCGHNGGQSLSFHKDFVLWSYS